MSTFFTLVFLTTGLYLFGAAALHAYRQRRAFKQGWAELEKELDEL